MKQTSQQIMLRDKIKAKGLLIGFIEKKSKLPRNTLYNHVNGSKSLPVKHLSALKKTLKKYKINLVV